MAISLWKRQHLEARSGWQGQFRRAAVRAVFVVVLSFAPTAALSTTVDDDYVASAQEFYDRGDIPAALIELKNALQANPDNPVARALLGKLYVDRGDFGGAEKELSRASNLGLNTEELRLMLARVRLAQGDFRGALAATEQAPDPGSPLAQELMVRRGDALLGLGRTEEATRLFQDALNVNPHAGAYAGLARASFASGHVDEALKFATKALEVDPGNASLHALIGALYWAGGRVSEATQAMSRALELDPEDLDALVGLTKLKLLAKDYADAKDYVDQALGVGGNRASLVVLKAYTELALHNYVLARTVAETVLADDSGNVTALYVSGAAGFALDETEQARRRLVQYLTRVPGDFHARAMLDYLNKARDSKSNSSQVGQPEPADDVRRTLLGLLSTQALAVGAAQTGGRALEVMATQAGDNPRLSAQLSISKSQAGELSRAEDELALAIRLDKDGQFAGEIDQAETVLILSHIRNRSLEKAVDLARAFIARRPEQATPYSLLSIAYAERGESAKALDAMQKARDKDPDAAEMMGNYAALQARLGDIKGATDTLKTSVSKHERHYPTLLQLASLFFSAGEIDQAIHWAEKALDVNPNAVEPRVILARSYNAQRKYEKALLATNGVVADNLGNAALLEAVGDAQFSLGRTADAVGTYEALVDAAPYSGAAYFYLARSYMENKQDDRVRPTLEKALAIDPENYPARVAFARFVLTTGDIDQAAPLVDSLAKQFKNNPEVLELSGRLALARGDYAGAATQLAEARDGFVKGGIVRRSVTEDLVEALWRQGHRDRALAEMEEWLRRNPDDVPMRLQVAAVQAQFGNIDAAADQYARAIETQPSNWLARNDLAMLLYRQGDYETASKHAEIAYQLAGDNAAVLDTLGVILLADRQVDRALPLLERANQVAPYQPEIALHLSDAYEQSGRKVEARTVLERVLRKLGEFEGRDVVEERYRDLAD